MKAAILGCLAEFLRSFLSAVSTLEDAVKVLQNVVVFFFFYFQFKLRWLNETATISQKFF